MATRNEIEIDIRVRLEQAKMALSQIRKHVKQGQVSFNQLVPAQKNVEKAQERLDAVLGKSQRAFSGYAMSIMFFGMAMQKAFTSIWKSSTKTFQDVMHSVEGTVTGVDMLNSNFEYLKFAVGSALEPVMQWLAPIVMKVAEWVSENQGLVRTITVIGTILGTLFAVGGAGKLALDGFAGLGDKLAALGMFKGTGGVFSWTKATPWIAAIIAAAAAFALMFKAINSNEETAEAAKKTFNGIKDSLIPLKESVLNFVNSLFDGSLTLEDFGWVAAWAFAVLGKAIEVAVEKMSTFINSAALVVDWAQAIYYAFKAAQQASLFKFGNAKESLQAARDQMRSSAANARNAAASFSSLGTTQLELSMLASQGPQAYKEQQQLVFQIQSSFNQVPEEEAKRLLREELGGVLLSSGWFK